MKKYYKFLIIPMCLAFASCTGSKPKQTKTLITDPMEKNEVLANCVERMFDLPSNKIGLNATLSLNGSVKTPEFSISKAHGKASINLACEVPYGTSDDLQASFSLNTEGSGTVEMSGQKVLLNLTQSEFNAYLKDRIVYADADDEMLTLFSSAIVRDMQEAIKNLPNKLKYHLPDEADLSFINMSLIEEFQSELSFPEIPEEYLDYFVVSKTNSSYEVSITDEFIKQTLFLPGKEAPSEDYNINVISGNLAIVPEETYLKSILDSFKFNFKIKWDKNYQLKSINLDCSLKFDSDYLKVDASVKFDINIKYGDEVIVKSPANPREYLDLNLLMDQLANL